jgi:hypothetical protein
MVTTASAGTAVGRRGRAKAAFEPHCNTADERGVLRYLAGKQPASPSPLSQNRELPTIPVGIMKPEPHVP